MNDIDIYSARVIDEMDQFAIKHYGQPRRSGRYPWGSGENPYQHTMDMMARVEKLKAKGWEETPENIMKEFGLTTTQYRAQKSLAKDLRTLDRIGTAKRLSEREGLGASEIAKRLSDTYGTKINESTVRYWLTSDAMEKAKVAKATADLIRNRIEETGKFVDVGSGVEIGLNISREKLNSALSILESEGYLQFTGGIPQTNNKGQQTITKVIGPKDAEKKDFYNFKTGEANIVSLEEYISRDGGDSFEAKFTYPESLNSNRLKVRYNEEGGLERDGLIELRRGVADLDLGESNYAQVRIMVDGTHYIKGMAVYGDDADFPDGVDVIFNTNKHEGTPVCGSKDNTVLKNIKNDPENPFGSAIKDASQGGQYWYTDENGEKKLGLINKRADQGDWSEWADKLPSQFLSKQSTQLAEQQLGLALADSQAEYDSIMSVTQPTIKKYLLNKFADQCDSDSVNLKAAALPGQKYHVMIPVNSLADNEVYAPDYPEGTQLALIRYPHGGTFEIPICTVTHKNKDAEKYIGKDAMDAVCVNKNVADRLSGADYDGDTVMCIPTNTGNVKITSTDELEGLKGFDSKIYSIPDGDTTTPRMKDTQKQMGTISNLITDMTLAGATEDELARAVRHSMVVIDAEKHELDYKKSEADNNIDELKRTYQRHIDEDGNVSYGGASSLISRAKGQATVEKRQGSPIVNIKGTDDYDPSRPEGALIYKTADDLYYTKTKVNKKTGEVTTTTETRTQKSTQMAETDDARTLISEYNTPMEQLYAKYANNMKALANKSRVEAYNTGKVAYSKEKAKEYSEEVQSLKDKLAVAESNKPKERQAQYAANVAVAAKQNAVRAKLKEEYPDASDKEINKMVKKEVNVTKTGQKALTKAREELGSSSRKERNIKISDKEWSAISEGAVNESLLKRILNNADIDDLRQRATPKTTKTVSQSVQNRIKRMRSSDYTIADIAKACGVSTSTVSKILKGE